MKFPQKSLFFFSIFFLFISIPAFSFGKKDKSETAEPAQESPAPETLEVKKEQLKINLFLDTAHQNEKTRFTWQNTALTYKDYFDTVSGASKVHSTKNLREFVFDKTTKNFQIPKGLYCLCLFAVASPDYLAKDTFKIAQDGLKLLITFTHRGNEYKIESDESGIIHVPESFSILIPENTAPKTEETPADSTEQADASPAPAISEFKEDRPETSLKTIFTGKLKTTYSAEGIFTLKGTLKLTENKEPEAQPNEESPASEITETNTMEMPPSETPSEPEKTK